MKSWALLCFALFSHSAWTADCTETHIYPSFPQNFSSIALINGDTTSHVYVSRWNATDGSPKFHVYVNQSGFYVEENANLMLAMTDPPGALPGSLPAINGIVIMQLGQNCQYSGVKRSAFFDSLPLGLDYLLNELPIYDFTACVGYAVCSNLTYLRTEMYDRTAVDVWNQIFPSSMFPGQVHNITVLANSKTGVPVYSNHFFPGTPHTFVPPSNVNADTHNTIAENPTIDFNSLLPKDWMHTCKNQDTGWKTVAEKTTFYTTSKQSDTASLYLSYPPVEGNVTVTFYLNSDWCSCKGTCFEIVPSKMVFFQENYNKPQTISFVYKETGCSGVVFDLKGGGYDIPKQINSAFHVFSCKNGKAGKSCSHERD